jgi:hypothetical protein
MDIVTASELEVIEDDSRMMKNPRLAFESEISEVQKALLSDPVKDLMSDESLKESKH